MLAALSAGIAALATSGAVAPVNSGRGRPAQGGAQRVTARDLQPLEDARKAAAAALGIKNAPQFDLDLIASGINSLRFTPYMDNGWAKGAKMPSFADVKLSPEDIAAKVMEALN